jgi:hypothetical protein
MRSAARHHDDGHCGIELSQLPQSLDALFIRHNNIANHQIEMMLPKLSQSVIAVDR